MRTPLYLFILFFIFIPSLSWAFNTVHTADYTYYPSFSSISKAHNTKGTHTDISNEHCTVLDIACIDKAFYVFGRDELFGLFLLKLTSFDHFKGFTVWLGPQENVIKIEGQNLFFLGGRLIAHNDILYCMSDGFQGIKMYSSQLKSLGILDTQASVSDIYFSQTGEVIARNKSTQLKKIDLQTKTVTPYLNTLSWSDRIGFSKAYLFKYYRWAITTGIILLVLIGLAYVQRWIERANQMRDYKIVCMYNKETLERYEALFTDNQLKAIRGKHSKEANKITGNWLVQGSQRNHEKVIDVLLKDESILEFDF